MEAKLLLSARFLVMLIPLCMIGGRVAVDAALTLTAILFLVHSAVAKDWAWARSLWFKIGVGLWLWMLFISMFAFDSGASYTQSVAWVRFLIFAAALEFWVLDRIWMHRLLMMVTAVVVFVAGDALMQSFIGVDLFGHGIPEPNRLSGPFNGERVGIFLADMMFPALLGGFVWRVWNRPWGKLLWVAMVLLCMEAVFLSGERMAALLSLAGLFFAALLVKGKLKRLVSAVLILVVIGSVLTLLLTPGMFNRQVRQTVNTAERLYSSSYGQIWRSALHLAGERPLVGVGMRNFRVACSDPVIGLPRIPITVIWNG